MFDSTNNYNINKYRTVVNIKPACVGTIQKSSTISKIVRCDINSEYAKNLLDQENPHIVKTIWHGSKIENGVYIPSKEEKIDISITVLQVMGFGDNQCLIEFITDEDYNRIKISKENKI